MGGSTQSNSTSVLVRAYEGFILWHFVLTVLGFYLIIRIAGVSKARCLKELRIVDTYVRRQSSPALPHL